MHPTSAAARRIVLALSVLAVLGSPPSGARAEDGEEVRVAAVDAGLSNGGFETGDFTGWQVKGSDADIAIVPANPPSACFQPDMPSEGSYMACLSTGGFLGGSANGNVRSDLTSEPLTFPFRPDRIKVTFTVEFQTEEAVPTIAFNDAFQARLVTLAGTFVMLQIDTFGHTSPGRGLKVTGFGGFVDSPSTCPLAGGQRTRRLEVTWKTRLDPLLRQVIGRGPVFVEFSIADQGDPERVSVACVDDVKVKISRP